MEISTWCGLNVSFKSSMLKLNYQGDDVRGFGRQLSYKDRILISGISSPMKGIGDAASSDTPSAYHSISQHTIHLQPSASWHQDTTPEAETSEYLCTP